MKTDLTTVIMIGISIALFRGNSSSELNLIFIYFSSELSTFLVTGLTKSPIFLHSSSHLFIISLFSLIGTSFKYLLPLISSKYYSICPKISNPFSSHILYKKKNIFVWIFIYFNIIWIKNFYIDNIIKKVVSIVFYIYIFDFITYFWFTLSI